MKKIILAIITAMTFNVAMAQQKFTKTTPEWAKNANIYEE